MARPVQITLDAAFRVDQMPRRRQATALQGAPRMFMHRGFANLDSRGPAPLRQIALASLADIYPRPC